MAEPGCHEPEAGENPRVQTRVQMEALAPDHQAFSSQHGKGLMHAHGHRPARFSPHRLPQWPPLHCPLGSGGAHMGGRFLWG